jgi:hypothetical protein
MERKPAEEAEDGTGRSGECRFPFTITQRLTFVVLPPSDMIFYITAIPHSLSPPSTGPARRKGSYSRMSDARNLAIVVAAAAVVVVALRECNAMPHGIRLDNRCPLRSFKLVKASTPTLTPRRTAWGTAAA